MPLKSKAQLRKLAHLEETGEVPKGTLRRFIDETPNMKRLPERVKKKKAKKKG